MGSILWRGERESVTIFEQTEESFLQSGGGIAVIDLNTCKMVPISKIHFKPGDGAHFELMKPTQGAALARMTD